MRRFGRNQKRKMREQLENISYAEKMSRELAGHYSDKLRSAKDEIEDAKRIIGQNSALFSPRNHMVNSRSRRYDVAIIPDISMCDIGNMPVYSSYKKISLPVMLLEVQNKDSEVFARLGNQIHMRLDFSDYTIGYACDVDALRNMGVDRIAKEVARLLHAKLQAV